MLHIREDQIRILQQDQARRFEDEMVSHLSERFAGRPVVEDAERLREFIQEGQAQARRYGIENEYDVRRFLEFRAEYGPGFDALPWAATILNDPYLSGCGKVEQIDAQSLFSVR